MENMMLLLDYQQADLELTNYETQAKDTPTRKKLMQIQRFVKNAQEKLAEMEAATKVKNGTITDLGTQYTKLVEDMEELNTDISYYSECEDEELNEKEIKKLAAGAERIGDEMTKIGKTLNALKTQIDADNKLAMQLLQKMKSAKAEYDTLKQEYAKEIEENLKDVDTYRAKVAAIEEQIDPKYIAEYKRIKGFRANPVAVFRDSRCGGCMMQLPSSTTGKIRSSAVPFVCENCGRILILE